MNINKIIRQGIRSRDPDSKTLFADLISDRPLISNFIRNICYNGSYWELSDHCFHTVRVPYYKGPAIKDDYLYEDNWFSHNLIDYSHVGEKMYRPQFFSIINKHTFSKNRKLLNIIANELDCEFTKFAISQYGRLATSQNKYSLFKEQEKIIKKIDFKRKKYFTIRLLSKNEYRCRIPMR